MVGAEEYVHSGRQGAEMTFLEALRKARPLIESGDQRFICFALSSVGAGQYKVRLTNLLGSSYTYREWVENHHPLVHREMERIPNAFRDGRLQWIDYMIAQEERRLDYTAASTKLSKIAMRIDTGAIVGTKSMTELEMFIRWYQCDRPSDDVPFEQASWDDAWDAWQAALESRKPLEDAHGIKP